MLLGVVENNVGRPFYPISVNSVGRPFYPIPDVGTKLLKQANRIFWAWDIIWNAESQRCRGKLDIMGRRFDVG